ncbi:MAG: 3-deoxy-8-phosphooctulonate synthase [Pirellulales bacterium]|nr:3-deoxy-8-phosphooctulonate synthase [Pirellulales bacterium]HJN66704.1 3-deoxy-8-phosphooctulonate synthase [Pirellulales bacterium]
MPHNPIKIGPLECGLRKRLLVIAGPCVIESEQLCLNIAERLADIATRLDINLIFKASFDKANRTSVDAFRGPGLKDGLAVLEKIHAKTGLIVTTDIHEPHQAAPAGEICDVLQIPAFLCRQTDLLIAAAKTGRAVNVKKGQFLAPQDMQHVIDKLSATGCDNILLCERGTFFGYGRLASDIKSLVALADLGPPVIFDATHSVQQPGSLDGSTGGNRTLVEPLSRAAVAVGIDGLFFETHPDPDSSPSDGKNMIPLDDFEAMLSRLLVLRKTVESLDPTNTTAKRHENDDALS